MSTLSHPVRSASLSGYLELMNSLGYPPQPLLRSVGLSTKLMENPETLIPSEAVRELLEKTAQTTGAEDFALQLAARRAFSNLGPISLVLKEEPTPREALATLCRYLKLLNASMVTRIEDSGSSVIVSQELMTHRPQVMRQAMELAVGTMFRLLHELIGPQWRPLQVCFTHRPPADTTRHRTFFGCKVLFNQEFNGLQCVTADLARNHQAGNTGISRFARDYLEEALARHQEGTRETVRQMVLALLPGGRCTSQQVAHLLRVDRRTLHRHLQTENVTFSGVLQQTRCDLVLRHLENSDMPLAEISELVGFSSPSAFSHWFRHTFGGSVREWRKKAVAITQAE